jgi:hypothetical protein
MSPRAAQVRMNVDADVFWLGTILAGLRNDVTYPGGSGAVIHKRQRAPCPITNPGVLDPDWIPQVAARGRLIITRDSMISQNRNERSPPSGRTRPRWWPSTSKTRRPNGPARSVHDSVAPHRGADLRARPVHLARIAHRNDLDHARLACARNRTGRGLHMVSARQRFLWLWPRSWRGCGRRTCAC